jgi:hypothetical protein
MSRLRASEHRVNAPLPFRARNAEDAGIKAQQFLRVEEFVVIGQFGQVTDPLPRDGLADIDAKDGGRAAGGADKAQQDIHGGGLAGPVRPQKAEDLASLHLQIQAIHGQLAALPQFAAGVLDPQVMDFHHSVHRAENKRWTIFG